FRNLREAEKGKPDSAVRMRKEMAAYQLNQMFGFDNGFPVTVSREYLIDGKLQRGWVQEKSGVTFEDGIRQLAKERYGSTSDDAVSQVIKEDPALKREVEQAFVERLIYGDPDNHAGNFVLVETPGGTKVQSIDLDYAFSAKRQPTWECMDSSAGPNSRLHADFS